MRHRTPIELIDLYPTISHDSEWGKRKNPRLGQRNRGPTSDMTYITAARRPWAEVIGPHPTGPVPLKR